MDRLPEKECAGEIHERIVKSVPLLNEQRMRNLLYMVSEDRFIPFGATDLTGARVLVLAPHPDDETLGCGGSILLHRRNNDAVKVVVLTNGALGDFSGRYDTAEYVALREKETRAAAEILDVEDLEFWKLPDRGLADAKEALPRLMRLMEDYEPDLIYAPSPVELSPDHRAAADLAWEAAKSGKPSLRLALFESNQPLRVNAIVDITDVIETKTAAAARFQSQFEEMPYGDTIFALNRFRAMSLGKKGTYAEGFWICGREEVRESSPHSLWTRQFAAPPLERSKAGPKVSVIIRTKDRPAMLREALMSVMTQTYGNIEVVVVNDGGRSVEAMLKDFEFVHPVVYRGHEKSWGRARAANTGLRAASGKYVNFLDDDDLFYPSHVETLVRFLEYSGGGGAYTDCEVGRYSWKDGGYRLEGREPFPGVEFDLGHILYENHIPSMNIMFEKEASARIGEFDESLDIYEDWDFWIRLGREVPVRRIALVTAEYRQMESRSIGTGGRGYDFTYWTRVVRSKHAGEWPDDARAVVKYLEERIDGMGRREGVVVAELEGRLAQKDQEIDGITVEIERLRGETAHRAELLEERGRALTSKGAELEKLREALENTESVLEETRVSLENSRSESMERRAEIFSLRAKLEEGALREERVWEKAGKITDALQEELGEMRMLREERETLVVSNRALSERVAACENSRFHRAADHIIRARGGKPVGITGGEAEDGTLSGVIAPEPYTPEAEPGNMPLVVEYGGDELGDSTTVAESRRSVLTLMNNHPFGDGRVLVFPHRCRRDSLGRIDLFLGDYNRINPGYIRMDLWRDGECREHVRGSVIKAPLIRDNSFARFEFDPVEGSMGTRYWISLNLDEGAPGKFPGLWYGALAASESGSYESWQKNNENFDAPHLEKLSEECGTFSLRPLISILTPVYKVETIWLEEAVESLLGQVYTNWELCLVDDCSGDEEIIALIEGYAKRDSRIRYTFLSENTGISGASNRALEMAEGEFVGLLDHDDLLSRDALYEVVRLINNEPDVDMIYSDEDKITLDNRRVEPFFKPDWSPDLILSSMYTCHFGVYRKRIVDDIGGFRKGYEGSQDYDLVLRFTEVTERIRHIPRILYHWRKIPGSTAVEYDNKGYARMTSMKSLEDAVERRGIEASVKGGLTDASFRVHRKILGEPMISIIIPFKDKPEMLKVCVESVLYRSDYTQVEIICVNNRSTEEKTFAYMEELGKKAGVRVLDYDHPFNYSAINNHAVTHAKGEYLLFLNNDMEVVNKGWLSAMLEHAQRPSVGAVGARLLYADGKLQHGGVVLGIGGVAGHAFKYMPGDHFDYYFGLPGMIRNVSGVTAACLLMRKSVFMEVEGFDEKDLKVAFNDVDLCLKIRKKGYRIVYTPHASLYHYESVSRGLELDPDEPRHMLTKWGKTLENDPYYNPNLSMTREDWSIRQE